MNKKVQKLRIKRYQQIPLYVSDLKETSSLIFRTSSGSVVFSYSPIFTTRLTSIFTQYTDMEIAADSTSASPIYFSLPSPISSGSGDCTGRYTTTFDNVGNILYVGADTSHSWKSWIPFTLTFDADRGINIISATLKVTSAETRLRIDNKPCKIAVACENKRNPSSPTTIAGLNSRAITKNYYSGSDVDSWMDGQEISFDITSSIKNLLGTSTVLWNNNDVLAVMLINRNSSLGSYRTMTSYEGHVENEEYAAPSLEIVYANNIYTDEILDTYISDYPTTIATGSTVNYNSSYIVVGERNDLSKYNNRGLIKADLSAIPSSASITSASLCLYHTSEKAGNTRTMKVYRMLTNWDLYGTCWNRKHGLSTWTGGGGGSNIADCESSWSGSISLSATESNGWKYIPLSSGSVEDWVTGALTNNGMMLKMDTESSDCHYFASSQYSNLLYHPKLVVSYTHGGESYIRTIQT